MKPFLASAAILAIVISSPTLAKSKHHHAAGGSAAPGVEVTERDAKGHPTMVKIDGQEIAVCSAGKTDGCVNPREAGLNFGNNPINNWPGKPASSK